MAFRASLRRLSAVPGFEEAFSGRSGSKSMNEIDDQQKKIILKVRAIETLMPRRFPLKDWAHRMMGIGRPSSPLALDMRRELELLLQRTGNQEMRSVHYFSNKGTFVSQSCGAKDGYRISKRYRGRRQESNEQGERNSVMNRSDLEIIFSQFSRWSGSGQKP